MNVEDLSCGPGVDGLCTLTRLLNILISGHVGTHQRIDVSSQLSVNETFNWHRLLVVISREFFMSFRVNRAGPSVAETCSVSL